MSGTPLREILSHPNRIRDAELETYRSFNAYHFDLPSRQAKARRRRRKALGFKEGLTQLTFRGRRESRPRLPLPNHHREATSPNSSQTRRSKRRRVGITALESSLQIGAQATFALRETTETSDCLPMSKLRIENENVMEIRESMPHTHDECDAAVVFVVSRGDPPPRWDQTNLSGSLYFADLQIAIRRNANIRNGE